MRTPVALAAVAVLMAAPQVPTQALAGAAAEECQGKPATIVATGQAQGTEGDDVIVLTGTDSGSGVSAAGGDDVICVRGVMPRDEFGGGPSVSGGPGTDSLEVRLGDGRDHLEVLDVEMLDVQLGGGLDQLRLHRAYGSGSIDGGKDGAVLKPSGEKRVLVDLEDQRMTLDGLGAYQVTGFSRVVASAPRVALVGDRRKNGLHAVACRVRVSGGRGNDALLARVWDAEDCTTRGVRLLGQKGDDRMTGTSADDVLLGGPGRDRAHGMKGVDTCVAETEKSCER